MQLHKQLTKPTHIYHAVGHDVILRLSTLMGDDILALRGLGDKIVSQKHCVAQSGPMSVGTISLVSVSGRRART
jgi:hypothetical protein